MNVHKGVQSDAFTSLEELYVKGHKWKRVGMEIPKSACGQRRHWEALFIHTENSDLLGTGIGSRMALKNTLQMAKERAVDDDDQCKGFCTSLLLHVHTQWNLSGKRANRQTCEG